MSVQTRCHCQSCTIKNLMVPALVITLGVLFLISEMSGGRFYFGNTWPMLILVIGVIQLASAMVPRDGHIDVPPPGTIPPIPPPAPPAVPPQTPFSAQGQ